MLKDIMIEEEMVKYIESKGYHLFGDNGPIDYITCHFAKELGYDWYSLEGYDRPLHKKMIFIKSEK